MSDETVIVVDIGCASTKAGYAGEDVPSSIFPSVTHKWRVGVEVIVYILLFLS
jgi:actin-related protein